MHTCSNTFPISRVKCLVKYVAFSMQPCSEITSNKTNVNIINKKKKQVEKERDELSSKTDGNILSTSSSMR